MSEAWDNEIEASVRNFTATWESDIKGYPVDLQCKDGDLVAVWIGLWNIKDLLSADELQAVKEEAHVKAHEHAAGHR